MNNDLLERLASLDTTTLSDALDGLGLPSGVGGLRAMTVDRPVIGFARTAALEPDDGGSTGAHILTGVVAVAGPQDALVIDNAGRTDVSAWGGILSLGAIQRGVRGVIVDGACRDIAQSRELGLGVMARAACPATARGRLRQRSVAEPVMIAGRRVEQGDPVFADECGFVVIPRARAAEVIAAAEAIAGREAAIVAELVAGAALPAVMRDARLAAAEQPS